MGVPTDGGDAQAGAYAPTSTGNLDAATDRAALVALYHATDGANWGDNTNWLSDAPLGEWSGFYTRVPRRCAWRSR